MRVVAIACEFSVVVQAEAARWQGLVGAVRASCDGVNKRNYGNMTSLPFINGRRRTFVLSKRTPKKDAEKMAR